MRVSMVGGNPTETEEYQLERDATDLKNAGDLDGAIECLRQAAELRGTTGATTRLAKYLQQAGRFDEALIEIRILIDQSAGWAKDSFGNQPPVIRRQRRASWLARIHRDAALICKREKNKKLQLRHEAAASRWKEKADDLEDAVQIAREKRLQAWEGTKIKGISAMCNFSKQRHK